MKRSYKWFYIIIVLALLAAPAAFLAKPAAADPIYTCLPSCEVNDGRMFAIAGSGLNTLIGIDASLSIASPANAPSVEIGIFDGDSRGIWDIGRQALTFTLYADPSGMGQPGAQLAFWNGPDMPNNAWFTATIPNNPAARSLSGNYFYLLVVRAPNAQQIFASRYKVRTDGVISLLPIPFAYTAALTDAERVIYPNYPSLTPTTYNGTFDFHTYQFQSQTSFAIWDGDMDFGPATRTTFDTDDPDTPNNVLPAWATSQTAFEGVAVGINGASGAPPDDTSVTNNRRSPNVIYDLALLDQTRYANLNPSGNIEWEQFRISSNASEPADYHFSGRLPAGLYHIHMEGMDMENLNAWRFPSNVLGVCALDPGTGEYNPCKNPLQPRLIGDTVFRDSNNNGVQDAGEAGIGSVRLELFDPYGFPILDINNNPITTLTNSSGIYYFEVEPRRLDNYSGAVINEGRYTVVVSQSNFNAGGPLAGLSVTTPGGNSQTNTVIDQNVLTYDFGYNAASTPTATFTPTPTATATATSTATPTPSPTPTQTPTPTLTSSPTASPTSSPTPTVTTTAVQKGTKTPLPKTGVVPYNWWRDNPQAWPVTSLTIGGVTYSREQIIAIMKTKNKGDKTLVLFNELVAARLNVLAGNDGSCILADMDAADAWLAQYRVGSFVSGQSAAWKAIKPVYERLSLYNRGLLCAPARP